MVGRQVGGDGREEGDGIKGGERMGKRDGVKEGSREGVKEVAGRV